MNPLTVASFLSENGFSVKQVPLVKTIEKLGKDGVNTFDLTTNFCDKYPGVKFWRCLRCSKMFDSKMSLIAHTKEEHYGFPQTKRVPSTIKKEETINSESEETSYIIVRRNPDTDALDISVRKKRSETKPRKPYEKRIASSKIDVNGPFSCSMCSTSFNDCCAFSMHMNTVHFKRRRLTLRCQICEKRFTGKTYNEVPDDSYQPTLSAPPYVCDVCGKSFIIRSHCEYHQKKFHSKMKPYECSLCSKSFNHVTGLSQHMKTHSGIRPFTCNICSKAFRQKAGLDQHMRIHSKVKPYQCLICTRAFTQSAHLSQHMRIHTKIEPFECSLCNRRFKQSSHLNFHLRSHDTGNNNDVYIEMESGVTITPLHELKI